MATELTSALAEADAAQATGAKINFWALAFAAWTTLGPILIQTLEAWLRDKASPAPAPTPTPTPTT